MTGTATQFLIFLANLIVTLLGCAIALKGRTTLKRKEYLEKLLTRHVAAMNRVAEELSAEGFQEDPRKIHNLSHSIRGIKWTISEITNERGLLKKCDLSPDFMSKLTQHLIHFRQTCSLHPLDLPDGYASRAQLAYYYFHEIETLTEEALVQMLK